MSADFRSFRCRGYGIIFTCDLDLDEIRFCPVCAGGGAIEIASVRLALCACGTTLNANDCEACPRCFAPMYDECAHARDACAAFNAERDLIGMPVEGRPS